MHRTTRISACIALIVLTSRETHAATLNKKIERSTGKTPIVMGSDKNYILAGNLIQVIGYDPQSKSYQLKRVRNLSEGALDATPESLAKGIHSLDLKAIRKKPKSIVGNEYSTDEDTVLLLSDELTARRQLKSH
jgi:hypothetical protein